VAYSFSAENENETENETQSAYLKRKHFIYSMSHSMTQTVLRQSYDVSHHTIGTIFCLIRLSAFSDRS